MKETNRRDLLLALTASLMVPQSIRAATALSGPPLWLAKRGAAKVYFFGQMPVRTHSHWQSSPVLRAFEDSAEVWTENPDPAAAPPPQSRTPSGPKLVESVTPEEMRRLRTLLVREGLKSDALDATHLSNAYSAVSYLQDHSLGVDYQAMPERVLRNMARAAGKAVYSEWPSVEDVTRFRASLAADTRTLLDLELFRRGLSEAEDVGSAQQQLDGWLRGDLRPLNKMERSVRKSYPLITQLVGADRNKNWVARTAEIMQRSATSFVCQGILHLLGPQSIQTFLRRAGHDVSRHA